MKNKGDHVGKSNPNAKLINDDIREIRQLREQGVSIARIAEMYNVSKSTISLISRRLSWKHVSNERNPTYFGVMIGDRLYKVERKTMDIETPLITDIPEAISSIADFIFDFESGNILRTSKGISIEKLLAKEALKWPLIIEDNI